MKTQIVFLLVQVHVLNQAELTLALSGLVNIKTSYSFFIDITNDDPGIMYPRVKPPAKTKMS